MTVWQDELPPPFVCIICEREIHPDPWHWKRQHKAPICNNCGTPWRGGKTRISGITRGDHRQLNRLAAITEALAGAAGRIEWGAKYGRY